MTIGEYMQQKLDEHNLNEFVKEKNVEYSWVTFRRIDKSDIAAAFAKFCAEQDLVSVRGNKDGSITCWF